MMKSTLVVSGGGGMEVTANGHVLLFCFLTGENVLKLYSFNSFTTLQMY